MMHILTLLYRRCLSEKVRADIYKLFLGDFLIVIRNPKAWFLHGWYGIYYSIITPSTEEAKVLKCWGKTKGLSPYPYEWKKEYDERSINYSVDVENNFLPYVIHHGKRLYFRHDMSRNISDIYRALLIEQDERSAHRYVTSYSSLQGKTLLDIGAAEAIFTLDVIEYIDHAYLFECDERWLEVLNLTFAPWKNKVTIVPKYVSNVNDENNVTLDAYFMNRQTDNFFLKMDIEGYERYALRGGKTLLKKANIFGAVCIYHLSDDKEVIQNILNEMNLITEVQPGYFVFDSEVRSAVLRFRR